MALSDSGLSSSGFSGGAAERALNDICLTVGFAMLVLVFVLVPYLTVLQRLAVNLPEDLRQDNSQPGSAAVALEVDVVVVRGEDGRPRVLFQEAEVELDRLATTITDRLGEELKAADQVTVALRADRDLDYQSVVEVLNRLKGISLAGHSRPRFDLLFTTRSEGPE